MSDDTESETGPQSAPGDDRSESVWDPAQILRDRATATRQARDASIEDLRQTMSDEEILDEFGIDLREIER